MTPEIIFAHFESAVNNVADNIRSFVKNPNGDFTRNGKIPIKKLLSFLVYQGSNSLRNELNEAYSFSADRPSASAFVQKRAKLKPEGVEEMFRQFSQSLYNHLPSEEYRLIADDGSTLSFLSNPKLAEEKYHNHQGNTEKGCYGVHINAFYDLDTNLYTDAEIQPVTQKDEYAAFARMVDRYPVCKDSPAIFIVDRGICSYNNMAHVIEKGQFFLFRAKDIESKGLLHHIEFHNTEEFDTTVKLILYRKQTKENKRLLPDGNHRFIGKDTSFDFLEYGTLGFYELFFRVVRFKLSDDSFETLVTNLPTDSFSAEKLKEFYNRRWGIETSFRHLKYSVGMLKLHASKPDFVCQEVWARLIAYNFSIAVINCVHIPGSSRMFSYKISVAAAVFACKEFIRDALSLHSFNIAALLARELIPIRPDRHFSRLQTAHFRKPAYFIYRPS